MTNNLKLKSLNKVAADGRHNAFTGLAYFNGQFILAFRCGPRHGRHGEFPDEPGGHQVRMTSADGENWVEQARTVFPPPPELPADTAMDYRDSYLVQARGVLYLYSFVSGPYDPQSETFLCPVATTVQISEDGLRWSDPRRIYEGAVLWKPIFWQDRFWCAGYRRDTAVGRAIELYQSDDGIHWQRGAVIAAGNECALLPLADGALRAVVRTNSTADKTELWDGHPPYTEWQRSAVLPSTIQAPHLFRANGRTLLLGREVPAAVNGKPQPPSCCRTKIWELSDTSAVELLELPSLGDTAYTGTALRSDGTLLVSYYSQHEREQGIAELLRGGNDKPNDVFVAAVEI